MGWIGRQDVIADLLAVAPAGRYGRDFGGPAITPELAKTAKMFLTSNNAVRTIQVTVA